MGEKDQDRTIEKLQLREIHEVKHHVNQVQETFNIFYLDVKMKFTAISFLMLDL